MPSIDLTYPRLFRTYKVRSHASPNCKIWEAARATTAAPTIFKGISIGESGQIRERFIDGGIKCNNPTKQVMDEARLLFGDDRHLGALVSIGTGHPGTIGLAAPDGFQKVLPLALITTLKKLATDCEGISGDVERQFKNIPDHYFRFNVTHGAGMISLEEWKRMGDVQAHTKAYLQDPKVSKSIDVLVKHLCGLSMTGPKATLAAACM